MKHWYNNNMGKSKAQKLKRAEQLFRITHPDVYGHSFPYVHGDQHADEKYELWKHNLEQEHKKIKDEQERVARKEASYRKKAARNKKYREKNKEKISAYKKEYREKNKKNKSKI